MPLVPSGGCGCAPKRALIDKFCTDAPFFVTRSSREVNHIFAELYTVPENIRKGYFKVKILSCCFSSALCPPTRRKRAGTPARRSRARPAGVRLSLGKLRAQVHHAGAVGALRRVALAHQQMLLRGLRHDAAAYLRAQKMYGAAQLLRGRTGPCSTSPGSSDTTTPASLPKAFRGVIGVSPAEYRSGIDSDSCAPFGD